MKLTLDIVGNLMVWAILMVFGVVLIYACYSSPFVGIGFMLIFSYMWAFEHSTNPDVKRE